MTYYLTLDDTKSRNYDRLLLYLIMALQLGFLLIYFLNTIYLLFWPHRVARGILVPQPGIELVPHAPPPHPAPAVEAQNLSNWTAREVPIVRFLKILFISYKIHTEIFTGEMISGICSFFFNIYILKFIYFWLHWVFVAVRRLSLVAESVGYSLLWCSGFSLRCFLLLRSTGSRAQAQQLWRTGLVAPQHVGSSRTRARTRVPCIGRWIPNHCATREALGLASK